MKAWHSMESRPKTLFVDIDGTLLYQFPDALKQSMVCPKLLPGVVEKLAEWDKKGYRVILVTGRKESERGSTEEQLHSVGIVYDLMIMGIGSGQRVVINDNKPGSDTATAACVCVERNHGIIFEYILCR